MTEISEMTEINKITKKHFCECCQYQTDKKYNFDKHLTSKKHIKKSTTEMIDSPICIELKIKKDKKLKPVMVEMETQTDVCDEEPCNDIIELENKNMILEEENNDLRNELKDKCEEFEIENKKLKCENEKMLKTIDELNAKNNQEIIEEMKRDINGYLFDIKEKDEEIIELKKKLEDKSEKLEQNIEMIIETKQVDEPVVHVKKMKFSPRKIATESNNVESENEQIESESTLESETEINDESSVQIKKMKFPPKKSKRELEMEKKIRELEIVNKNLKNENIELQVSSYSDENSHKSKKNKKIIKNDSDIITRSEIREICNDINVNTCIKNYCEKNYNNEIVTHKILKFVDICAYNKNSDKLYFSIFNNIMDSIPYERKPFLCVDSKRKIFNYYDEVSKKWKLTNNRSNEIEFEEYLKYVFSCINKSLIKSLLNTKELPNEVFKEIYDRDKKTIFGNSGEYNLIGNFTMLLYCDLFDTSNVESAKVADAFMKHVLVICSNVKAKKNKSKKHKKPKKYESDDSDDSDESDNDSEIEEDD